MEQTERLELAREVAAIIGEANRPLMSRVIELEESGQRILEQLIDLNKVVVTMLAQMSERQDQVTEALGLIIEKLRKG